MKEIKRLLKKCDLFGVPFSFKYKKEERYSTSLGGFFFILYIIIVIVVGIYYLIPFFDHKKYSIVYYSMNLSNTEQINLKESKTNFAIGFDCEVGANGTKAEDLLEIKANFITFTKYKNGKEDKKDVKINTHFCNYSDFYDSFNDSIDILNINKLLCLDKTDNIIQGIYTDEVFTYYQFSVQAKYCKLFQINR